MAAPMVIDLTPDDSDGERPCDARPSEEMEVGASPYSQTVEVLAPLFTDLPLRPREREIAVFPVTFQRTDADWIKLVFPHVSANPTHNTSSSSRSRSSLLPLEKELVCANSSADGCRNCRFAQLLRGLLVLIEKRVFLVDAKYVVSYPTSAAVADSAASTCSNSSSNSDSGGARRASTSSSSSSSPQLPEPVATIQLFVQLNESAPTSVNLQDFAFVLSHLQPAILSVVGYTRVKAEKETSLEVSLKKAKESTCHVVGCNLHQRDGSLPGVSGTSKTLYLSDVFLTLTSPTDTDQMEIREDRTYVERMKRQKREVIVTDLPIIALQTLVCMMDARDLASLSGVCSLFQHLSYEVVPGLNLVLYRHQRKALKFLLYREAPASAHTSALPHPFIFPPVHRPNAPISIDLVDRKIINQPTPMTQDCRGGLFCDEPGLGKTITMLALLLRTKGQRVKSAPDIGSSSNRTETLGRLRSSESRGRTVQPSQLVKSATTLIVVPDPLVDHWKYQIEMHVEPGALKVFVDSGKTLPSSAELATYDVVITSLSRLAQEWKYNRPASALEERAPERYGFEGPARYVDGEIRGEVSSLLKVHWVRIVVDEGHKLGGTAETHQMRMARIFYAEKRWVMTGTPTPNTMHSADLRHMHGLLVFLKDVPYGQPDGKAWLKAVAKPFEQNEPIAFLRLQRLLSRIMMRHTKEFVREIIPDPIWRTVFIDPTPKEHDMYNSVASVARANLVTTNYDPKYPGRLHLDSLLNPLNRKYAMYVVKNLRIATCGGESMSILLTQAARVDAVNYAIESGIRDEKLTALMEYMHRAQEAGESSPCGSCKRNFKLLMLVPCGHLCCADCIGDRIESVGPRCSICDAAYDIEVFQKLQPGFEFIFKGGKAMENLNAVGAEIRVRERERDEERRRQLRAWQEGQRSGESRVPNPRLAVNYLRDFDIVDASKALYVVARVKELKKEYAQNYAEISSGANRSRNVSRHVKTIVFSQFSEHIWELKIAFAQQGIQTADFITGLSQQHRLKYLTQFRKDPSVNVLLLTEVGSHGLDLSFVTHVFLLEEIWDKSLEKQVVSRAHRMGARQAVVIEQLVMRDTVESILLRMNEQILKRQERRLKAAEAEELSLMYRNEQHQQGYHASSGTNNLEGMFQAHKKQKKRLKAKAPAAVIAHPAAMLNDSNENKATRLQQQLYYVLQNLRLLGEDVIAEPGHVRFAVEDEHGNVVRTGSHRMAAYKTSSGQLVTMPPLSASDARSGGSASGSIAATPSSGGQRLTSPGSSRTSATVNVKSERPAAISTSPVHPTASVELAPASAASNPQVVAAAPATATSSKTKRTRKKKPLIGHRAATEASSSVKSEVRAGNDSSAIPNIQAPSAAASSTARLKTEPSSEQGAVPTAGLKAEPSRSNETSTRVVKAEPSQSNETTARTVKAEPSRSKDQSSSTVKTKSAPSKDSTPKTEKPESKRSESSTGVIKSETTIPSRVTVAHAAPTTVSPVLGTATDPILLSDGDEDMHVIISDEDSSTDARADAAVTTGSATADKASGNAQKRPIRRVKFAAYDDSSETESDYVPSDAASDD